WPHLAGCDQGLDGVNGDNDPAAPIVARHGRQARVRKLSGPDQIANVIGTAADNGGCLFDAERQALGKIDARLFCGGAHRGALPVELRDELPGLWPVRSGSRSAVYGMPCRALCSAIPEPHGPTSYGERRP